LEWVHPFNFGIHNYRQSYPIYLAKNSADNVTGPDLSTLRLRDLLLNAGAKRGREVTECTTLLFPKHFRKIWGQPSVYNFTTFQICKRADFWARQRGP